jgi:hypothetical protein
MDIKCPPKYTKNFLDMCYESELTPNMAYLEMIKDFAYFEALQVKLNFIHRCPMGMVIRKLVLSRGRIKNYQKWCLVHSGGPSSSFLNQIE